jgi:hypothetical protein
MFLSIPPTNKFVGFLGRGVVKVGSTSTLGKAISGRSLQRMIQKARELFGENIEFRGFTQKINEHYHDHLIRK